jgi:ribosome-associated protein
LPVAIRGNTIELGALLKLALRAQSGGEAKAMVQAGQVRVNGSVETRRHRQLHPGDQVACPDGTVLQVVGDA